MEQRKKSHYEILGIHPNSTQKEIKEAYYKLSKVYHPDISKEKDTEEMTEKFRLVTDAYEVLGNYKLRKLYDKGILSSASGLAHHPHVHEEPVEDDPTTKFYKSRMHRSNAPTVRNSTGLGVVSFKKRKSVSSQIS